MNRTVVLSSCISGVIRSFTVDARILAKGSCIRRSLNQDVTARFCTSTSSPQLTSRDDESESDSEAEVGETRSLTNKFLIVGLGNPEMQSSRYSVGMQFVNVLAKKMRLRWTAHMFNNTGGFTASAHIGNYTEMHLLKPRLPVNINGASVIKSTRFFDVKAENVYLIHALPDMAQGEFDISKVDFESHSGVASTMETLKSDEMTSVAIGIDCPPEDEEAAEYVWDDFTNEEYGDIGGAIKDAMETLITHIEDKHDIELDIRLSRPLHVKDEGLSRYMTKVKKLSKGKYSKDYRRGHWNDRDSWHGRDYGNERESWNERNSWNRRNSRNDRDSWNDKEFWNERDSGRY
ncbi:probable peptidyl-tRNA hydrolase [Haliotis asinina]|uniref:probable peptidyl-tRNA hydrolase n=1 Tax=Haliotis asinina TaxID=109174 RepID=UPI003532080A